MLGTACTIHAGELRLNNGAILPGELVSISSETLVWKADRIGDITVSKSDIIDLQTSHRTAVEVALHTQSGNDCIVGVKNSLWSVECEEQVPHPIAAAALQSLPPANNSATGKITTSLDIDRGSNPSEELNIDLTARWLRPTHRHNVDVSVDYETSDGETTNDDADANYQYDFLRANGWFWFGRLRYYRDTFDALEQVYAAGGGIGRDFTPLDDLTLSIQGGPAELYYYYDDRGWAVEPGANTLWRATWNTPWHGIKASHSGQLTWVFSIEDGYLFQTKTGLTFPLYEGLIGEVRLDYDRSGLNAIDGKDYDIEWVLGLGYTW